MKRLVFVLVPALLGCFQEIDFPGEQAEVEIEPINGIDAAGVNEAIFDELEIDALDVNADGVADVAVSSLLILASDQANTALCNVASDANNFAQIEGGFNDAKLAGTLVVAVEDLAQVNGASGFKNGDNIRGNNNDVIVVSFFVVTENGDFEVRANTAGQGDIDIDTINNDELNATFDDILDLDFAFNANGDPINSNIDGALFNATQCDMDVVLEDIINGFLL